MQTASYCTAKPIWVDMITPKITQIPSSKEWGKTYQSLLLDYAAKLLTIGTTPVLIISNEWVTVEHVWVNPAWEETYNNAIMLLRRYQTLDAQNHLVQSEPLGNKITKIRGISSQQE